MDRIAIAVLAAIALVFKNCRLDEVMAPPDLCTVCSLTGTVSVISALYFERTLPVKKFRNSSAVD
jgi:hypothetical protein